MLTVAIQAGGESRRMGQDKALMPFLGRALIIRLLERIAPIADEVIVATNNLPAYQFLGLPLFPDLLNGRGALGGLYTSLSAASRPFVAVVACDMPFASATLLAAMHETLLHGEADLAIPVSDAGQEPFHAVYRRATCLPPIQQALRDGKWRVDSWFGQVRLHPVTLNEVRQYDPHGLCFRNVNTTQEFAQAEKLAMEMEKLT